MLENHKVADPTSKGGNEVHEGITAPNGQSQVRLHVLLVDRVNSNSTEIGNEHGEVLGTWRDLKAPAGWMYSMLKWDASSQLHHSRATMAKRCV
jgi:hypothetical protein